ncbi:hypothetical protein Efla_006173 [Eimeria flavescens]
MDCSAEMALLLGVSLQHFASAHAVSTSLKVSAEAFAEASLKNEHWVPYLQRRVGVSPGRSNAAIAVVASIAVALFLLVKCAGVLRAKGEPSERFLAAGGAEGGGDGQCAFPPPPTEEPQVRELLQQLQSWAARLAELTAPAGVDEVSVEEHLVVGQQMLAAAGDVAFGPSVPKGLRDEFRTTLQQCIEKAQVAALSLHESWKGIVETRSEFLGAALSDFVTAANSLPPTVPVESHAPVIGLLETAQSSLEAAQSLHMSMARVTTAPLPSGQVGMAVVALQSLIQNVQENITRFVTDQVQMWRQQLERIRQARDAGTASESEVRVLTEEASRAVHALRRASGLDVNAEEDEDSLVCLSRSSPQIPAGTVWRLPPRQPSRRLSSSALALCNLTVDSEVLASSSCRKKVPT